ncbi:hypothetical protein DFJ74DRAFT_766169 [Hyaloraphidium curvatum]|nr:hypothetical protein DFJ74DRAFT_766169 [Hyaloraphidium curvatum]
MPAARSPARPRAANPRRRKGLGTSLWDRLQDALMAAEIHLASLEWLDLASLSFPVGVCCNALLLSCRLSATRLDSGLGFDLQKVAILQGVLFAFSVLNTIRLFTTTKKYELFRPSSVVPPKSPNARTIRVERPAARAEAEEEELAALPRQTFFQRLTACCRRRPRLPEIPTDEATELSVWDPRPGNLNLFCIFSPVHVFLLLGTDARNLAYVSLACAVLAAGQFALANAFLQLVRDRQILSEHLFLEYDEGFVKPRLSVRKESKAVQADDRVEVQAALSPKGRASMGGGENARADGSSSSPRAREGDLVRGQRAVVESPLQNSGSRLKLGQVRTG